MNANISLTAAVALVLAGCGATTPERLDAQMGSSVEMLRAQQTANPQAAADTRPVQGLDGKAADAAVGRYRKSFETPPPPSNVFNIGVGAGGTGSSR